MIRRATITDIDDIMGIVSDAQQALRELGIDQWQDGYPSKEVIHGDIEAGVGYVYTLNNVAIGYAAIVLTKEDAYLQISDDEWGTGDDYVVVHRLCVKQGSRRNGIAVSLMRHAKKLALEVGYTGFRIDTHRGNIRMLAMMKRLGFKYRGIIHYDSGERMAYDMKLDSSSDL